MVLKIFSFLFFVLIFSSQSFSQLLNENFDYGGSDNPDITSVSSWVRHSGTQGPRYVSAGLSYSGYVSSGIGGAINFTNGSSGVNDGDVHRTFDSVTTTNNIFVSFLVRVDTARATADYFLHLGPKTLGTTFRGRVFARTNGTGWSLSLSKFNETPASSTTVLNLGQTYLAVLKYSFNTTTNDDDVVTLYLYDSGVPSSEPGSPLVTLGPTGSGTSGDPANIGSVAIRQGLNTPYAFVDGIRISTSWGESPLPVELNSFFGINLSNSIKLIWQTSTEINNFGFEIERSENNFNWDKIGFVAGNGNSNSPKEYSFIDDKLNKSGKYYYRLKQLDIDGGFEYSNVIEVDFVLVNEFQLHQNYPNPFNPITRISWYSPVSSWQTLKVYDVLSNEVTTLVNEFREAGKHEIKFDASNLPSGIYYYQLNSGGLVQSKKMLLVK